MCGIAGWYARAGKAVDETVIRRQCESIQHRGPDDQGLLVDGDFGFGMRRLSIIDIAGGHQPMESGPFAIVFNGEIYNHLALRAELVALGVSFRTRSDTETILEAFREWGNSTWAKLDGMFAVAIWERSERRLTLARDMTGIKPLYVSEQNGGLAFASELKALMGLPGHLFETDAEALHEFFCFGHTLPPRSIYRQVSTLPPGHLFTVGPDGPAEIRAYWQPTYRPHEIFSEQDWIAEFRERWLATVSSHMLADVEVGAFLSGGVDSFAVVAAMTQVSDHPVRTFTIGFPHPRFNEAPYAERVAHHLGCLHSTKMVDLKAACDILPAVQRSYDEPFADPSAVPTWYLSQVATQNVKVALSGDGGDELFMGYKRHLAARRLRSVWPPLGRAAVSLRSIATGIPKIDRRLQKWQKFGSDAGLSDGIVQLLSRVQITTPELRARIFEPRFLAEQEGPQYLERLRDQYYPAPEEISSDPLEQFVLADLALNLPAAMLTKVDRASMAHSLEVRVPMLSPSFLEWGLSVPTSMKLRGRTGKYIVRKAIEPWLPAGILDRPKQGFKMPLSDWFAGDFGSYARDVWRGSGAADDCYFNATAVENVFDEHRAGTRDHSRFLYAVAIYGLWRSEQTSRGPSRDAAAT